MANPVRNSSIATMAVVGVVAEDEMMAGITVAAVVVVLRRRDIDFKDKELISLKVDRIFCSTFSFISLSTKKLPCSLTYQLKTFQPVNYKTCIPSKYVVVKN